jgi:hypothetical protein
VHHGGEGVAKQSSSHHSSQETEKECIKRPGQDIDLKNMLPVTLPTSSFSPPPNNAVILWIRQQINPLIWPEVT